MPTRRMAGGFDLPRWGGGGDQGGGARSRLGWVVVVGVGGMGLEGYLGG